MACATAEGLQKFHLLPSKSTLAAVVAMPLENVTKLRVLAPEHARRPAALSLAAGELHFRHLLDKLPAGAYTCDRDGLITYYNPHAVELWGRAPKLCDPVERFCGSFKLFSPDGSAVRHGRCSMALALETDREYNGCEIVVERPDGTRRTVLTYANPIHDEHDAMIGAVNVLVDITDRKRAELALEETDRRKDEFLATLAHELRNPLAPIRSALPILRLTGKLEPAKESVLDMLERQVDQLVRLVDDLMEVSRMTRGTLELRRQRVDIASVVASALETSRPSLETSGHRPEVALPATALMLDADPVRLAQVFANLLDNAAKHTAPGGRISLAACREGDQAVIRVADTGEGISPSMLPKIFDLFTHGDHVVETGKGGLGVGLTVVKNLVEKHGGSVTATSGGPGSGSEFTVRLPVAEIPLAERAPPPQDGESSTPAHRRVLIVDDNRDAAGSLGVLVELLGSDVKVVYDGATALATLPSYQPSLVLLDIGMPQMDGYEVARRIRALPEGRHVTIVALTGWGQDQDRRSASEAGFDRHFVKPIDLSTLQALLGTSQATEAPG
jgi:PAS domain S-box-containing protein